MTHRSARRLAAGILAGVALSIAAPLAASAHIGISPDQAEPEAYTNFTFTVPNESSTNSTVEVEIALPTDTPILSVRYAPVPGWTAEVVEEELPEPVEVAGTEVTSAKTRLVFTADAGSGIGPDQFGQFDVSFGPIPETGQISFPSTQTYDDGRVVEWSATPAELEADDSLNPAPTLFITDEPAGHHGATADDEASADQDAHGEPANATAADTALDPLPVILSVAALVLGAAALVVALLAARRRA